MIHKHRGRWIDRNRQEKGAAENGELLEEGLFSPLPSSLPFFFCACLSSVKSVLLPEERNVCRKRMHALSLLLSLSEYSF